MAFRKRIKILTRDFPKEEIYGLSSQVNRAALSIVLNIAEGSERYSDLDFSCF
ncbi:MAG: four helix bundle protein [Patescibacteria group bacterium]|nr:four helix bundle protein [Patescibacteria group bacterium]